MADTSTTLVQDEATAANQNKPGYDVLGAPVVTPPVSTSIPGGDTSTNQTKTTPNGTQVTLDANGKPITPAPVAPIASPYYSRIGPPPTPVVAQTAEEIQQQKQKDAQALIDSINAEYDSKVKDQTVVNDSRDRGTNAISTLNGLAGSSDANNAAIKTSTQNKTDIDAINAQRAAAVQGILSKISDSAQTQANFEQQQARLSEQDQQTYADKAKTDATTQLTQLALAHGGVTLDGLKATLTPDEYNYLVKNVGGEAQANAILFDSRPKTTLVGTPQVFGSQVFQAYNDPATNTVKYESIPLPAGVDPSGIQSLQKTDQGLFIINKDGTWKKIPGSQANKTTGTTPKTTVITSTEAKSLGLPATVVGKSETDILNTLKSTTIPQWFIDKAKAENTDATQDLWNTYRNQVTSSTEGSA